VTDATRAEVCVVACAEVWRGDGEIVASPMGVIPIIGARLAKATFEPDLVVTDGEAYVVDNVLAVGPGPHAKVVAGWLPFRSVFDVVASGRRHVMMGASQIDRFGNQNISAVGDWRRPKVQLLGVRGAPGNTVNHTTSYWVPNHSPRVFVERVDMVSGVGHRRAQEWGSEASRYNDIRRVITNLAVLDFEARSMSIRLRSVHPGVSVDQVKEATGFELIVDESTETRWPTEEELHLIRQVIDPAGLRDAEVRA
jgi:acyl CoA:acetate/3-ketoacid CoA transferase beta subunit